MRRLLTHMRSVAAGHHVPTQQAAHLLPRSGKQRLNRFGRSSQANGDRLDGKPFDLVVPPGTLVVDASGRQLSTAEIEALRGKLAGR